MEREYGSNNAEGITSSKEVKAATKRTTRGTNFKIKYQIKLLFKRTGYCLASYSLDPFLFSPKDNRFTLF
jgi:hypothetical protein